MWERTILIVTGDTGQAFFEHGFAAHANKLYNEVLRVPIVIHAPHLDDSADHRGILSWYSQKRDRFLREAGSYGYLVNATIPQAALQKAAKQKKIVITAKTTM